MPSPPPLELTGAERRLCLFLNLLGEDAREPVLAAISSERIEPIRQGVADLDDHPPTVAEAEAVIDEFQRLFQSISGDPQGDRDGEGPDGALRAAPRGAHASASANLHSTGAGTDALTLASVEPHRLAAALRSELPQTVAVVVSQLPAEQAGEVLAWLPPLLRSQVMIRLRTPSRPAPRLVEQLVAATLRRAAEIDPSELAAEAPAEEKMARLLRAMPRKDRRETLTSLSEADPELAEAVQGNMFQFDDLLRIDDRSVQSLLAEIDSESLSLALKDSPPEFLEKVVGNLSKRAGESLAEEVSLMPPVDEDDQAAARQRVVQLFSKLDQEGSLRMQ